MTIPRVGRLVSHRGLHLDPAALPHLHHLSLSLNLLHRHPHLRLRLPTRLQPHLRTPRSPLPLPRLPTVQSLPRPSPAALQLRRQTVPLLPKLPTGLQMRPQQYLRPALREALLHNRPMLPVPKARRRTHQVHQRSIILSSRFKWSIDYDRSACFLWRPAIFRFISRCLSRCHDNHAAS